MKNILYLLIITSSLYGCGIFGPSKGSNDTTKPIPLPPIKINNDNMATRVNESQLDIEKPAKSENTVKAKPRIQEERSLGGTVEQIKVNNKHLPDYYVYPSTEQNLNNNNQPNKDITTPSWQINW